jgi:DNA-directed DNA polymerase III PolC
VSSPEALLSRTAKNGGRALALTDVNNLYGVVPFVELAARHGVRPIIGSCLRFGGQQAVALVADRAGYRNLCRVISRIRLAEAAGEEASGGREPSVQDRNTQQGADAPRSPLADPRSPSLVEPLRGHGEGLHVLVDEPALAEALRDAFRHRLWLEVVRPNGSPRREEALRACGKRLGLRLVASTAAHLAGADDYPTFRLATAVRRRTLIDRLPAVLPVTPEHRLLSEGELRRRFRDLPEAVDNTDDLALLLRSDVLPREVVLPKPKLTRPLDLTAYLRGLCERGLRDRDLGGNLEARQRLREELSIIEANNLSGYFLTVRDIARAARKRGRTMALRGSAGNSLVCYLLAITDVDPLRFRLELERFLHPGRADLPDIDLDFDWKVRDEIIEYVIGRYGSAHVARISAHQFLQPRSAFRESGKLHGLSNEQISELLTHLDERVDEILLPGKDEKQKSSDSSCLLSSFPLEPERWPRLVHDARRLLGRPSHLSLHPGGVVITPQPIDSYAPVQWAAKGVVMTQMEKDAVEYIGLVKIDLLGNRALATVDEARSHARGAVPAAVRSDSDGATAELLRKGDTLGVTQLESPAMRHLLIQMRARGLDDVIQSLALLRPGAASIGMKDRFIRRRLGLEEPEQTHPATAALLGETHGLMLYEDDSLRLIQALTGLPAADADRFRKRIARHETDEEAEELRREFLDRCGKRGVPGEALAELWVQLAKFNRYSFCKSHAVSYGLIAWQAAYLKAHHPLAFWTAVLNNNQGAYPRRVYVEAVKRAGVEILLPCVNRSRLLFHPEEGAIRVGLEAIGSLPQALRQELLDERRGHGPYRDLGDLRRRVAIGPEALSVLIRSGALDFTGRSRPALFLEARLQDAWRSAVSPAGRGRKASGGRQPPVGCADPQQGADGSVRSAGVCSLRSPPPAPLGPRSPGELFSTDPAEGWSPPDDPPHKRWRDAWDTLGFVLGPPLFTLFRPSAGKGPPLISSLQAAEYAGRLVQVQGLTATARHVFTEDGRPVQFVTLEDEYGFTEVTLFGGACEQVPYLTMGPYIATGVMEERYGALTVTARGFERAGVTSCER